MIECTVASNRRPRPTTTNHSPLITRHSSEEALDERGQFAREARVGDDEVAASRTRRGVRGVIDMRAEGKHGEGRRACARGGDNRVPALGRQAQVDDDESRLSRREDGGGIVGGAYVKWP